MTADAADAATAAVWCDARSEADRADALILTAPVFGRRPRRGLDIACPVLVLGQAGGADQAAVKLGPHVTWLRLEDPPAGPDGGGDNDRRRFFDEMGRWLGAYMYGQVRDQLL
jgi:hypothetical protein